MPEDSFRYTVELDTQGMAAQLASVRDIVAHGLGTAAGGIVGAAGVAGGAANQLSSDLFAGQQMIAAAMPAQISMLPPGGIASTTLANVPGMPQGFMGELFAATGVTRAPLGVFPEQYRNVAIQRLGERVQVGAATAVSTLAVGTPLGALGGAVAGGALGSVLGPAGTFVGGIAGSIAGYMIGDTLMAPFMADMQGRMADRARLQQIFGWNQFRDDERTAMAGFMRQRFTNSLFDQESFNQVLPAAVKAGFFRGVGRNDVAGFRGRFEAAAQFFEEAQFTLGVSGAEGIMAAGELARGFRRMGVRDPRGAGAMFRQANILAADMRALGEYVDPMEIAQQQLQVGQTALQFGVSPQRAMEVFASQSAMTNRLIQSGQISDDDLALLGGTPGEAAQRLTSTVMATQRHPVFRAMALAFGGVDATTGKAEFNKQALESVGAGRMSFSALTERMSQQLGTGAGGTTKLMTLMANQQKLQGDQLVHQGQMLRSLTDDLLRQAGLEVTDGTRMFMMQRVFGVGESESRALVAGLPAIEADKKRLADESVKLDSDVKQAIQTQHGGAIQKMTEMWRETKDFWGAKLDWIGKSISDKMVPPLEAARDRLDSMNEIMKSTGYRGGSPIQAGPITFAPGYDEWMHPKDPAIYQGFRSVTESRMYPKPLVSARVSEAQVPIMTRLKNPVETMAG